MSISVTPGQFFRCSRIASAYGCDSARYIRRLVFGQLLQGLENVFFGLGAKALQSPNRVPGGRPTKIVDGVNLHFLCSRTARLEPQPGTVINSRKPEGTCLQRSCRRGRSPVLTMVVILSARSAPIPRAP